MKAVHSKRLEKLAEFLDTLPRQKFNFEEFVREEGKPMAEALKAGTYSCGTAACALGWTPAVFPRLVRWVKDATGRTRIADVAGGQLTERALGQELFGLSESETVTLFYPKTHWVLPGVLPPSATPKQVARHIRRFLKSRATEKAQL